MLRRSSTSKQDLVPAKSDSIAYHAYVEKEAAIRSEFMAKAVRVVSSKASLDQKAGAIDRDNMGMARPVIEKDEKKGHKTTLEGDHTQLGRDGCVGGKEEEDGVSREKNLDRVARNPGLSPRSQAGVGLLGLGLNLDEDNDVVVHYRYTGAVNLS